MDIKYLYRNTPYDTEQEAQDALAAMKIRLDNNPTDWCVVKYIEGIGESSWTILPDILSDEQINNPDSTKTYTLWATWTGFNFFPLTSEELTQKVIESRQAYVAAEQLAVIKSFDYDELELVLPPEDGVTIPSEPIELEFTDVATNEDMSGYL